MKKVTYILALLAILAIGALIGGNWLRDNKLPNFRKQAEIYSMDGLKETLRRRRETVMAEEEKEGTETGS